MKFGVKLGLTTGTVVAALIVAGGASLVFVSDQQVRQSLDRDLIHRAENFHRPPPGGPPDGGPPDQPPGLPDAFAPPDNPPRRNPPPNEDGPLRPRVVVSGETHDPSEGAAIDPAVASANLTEGAPYLSTIRLDERIIRVVTIHRPNGATVQVGGDLADIDRIRNTQIQLLALLIPCALIAGGLVGYLFAHQALEPVNRVTLAASQLDDTALSTRLPVVGNDELAALASQFNQMLERLDTSFGHRQKLVERLEKLLESQRAFVADASHELKTPLARLKLIASASISQDSSPEDFKAALIKVNMTADQMAALVQQLLVLARYDSALATAEQTTYLAEIVAHAQEMAESIPGPPLQVDPIPDQLVKGRVDDLSRAVANVIENARRYAPESPQIHIKAVKDQGLICLSISDQGPGVPAEALPHLTERFFRVDSARARTDGGTGLGLAITKSVLESSGGKLEVLSIYGQGTTVNLWLVPAVISTN